MADDEQKVVPALYEQCIELYEAMADRSKMEKPYHDAESEVLVYDGHLTKLVTEELHYSVPYYTKLKNVLKDMDCIRQIRRGGSTTTSRWMLLQHPTLELFTEALGKSKSSSSWKTSMEQRIRDLETRMTNAGI